MNSGDGVRRAHQSTGAAEMNTAEGRMALAVIRQALADLGDIDLAVATEAERFLTVTLWAEADDDDALAFRDLVPVIFTAGYKARLLERVRAIMAGEAPAPGPLVDSDGVMTYEEVLTAGAEDGAWGLPT